MSDILDKIAAYKRIEVAERKAATPLRELTNAADAASPPRGFRRALAAAHGARSPGPDRRGEEGQPLQRPDPAPISDPAALARAYQAGGATCLSVLTDSPSFQGADAYLAAARDARRPALPAQGIPSGPVAGDRITGAGRGLHLGDSLHGG